MQHVLCCVGFRGPSCMCQTGQLDSMVMSCLILIVAFTLPPLGSSTSVRYPGDDSSELARLRTERVFHVPLCTSQRQSKHKEMTSSAHCNL